MEELFADCHNLGVTNSQENYFFLQDLYREFCANEETYKNVHDKGRLLQSSRDDAAGSNVEQCVTLLEQRWQSMSTKMEERKVREPATLA